MADIFVFDVPDDWRMRDASKNSTGIWYGKNRHELGARVDDVVDFGLANGMTYGQVFAAIVRSRGG